MSRTAHALRAFSVVGLFVFAGCTIDLGEEAVTAAGRGATPEALDFGTCTDSCGGPSADGCWCDDQCEAFGDCCSDYEDVCVAIPMPCPFEILCAPDTWPTDTDNDGCQDSCETISCFDDSMCPGGGHCTADDLSQCCPPNALCDLSMPPCDGTCTWEPVEPPPHPCAAVDCAPGYMCVADDDDQTSCVPTDDECMSDADCPQGVCNYGVTCAGLGCPPPPANQCLSLPCDDGTPALCEMIPPTCADDEIFAVRNHCFSCLPADSCVPTFPPPPPPPPSCAAMLCGPGYTCVDGPDGGKCVLVDGACESDDQCADGEFCEREDGLCNATGECSAIPQACYQIFAPVCGCDGETYSNDCHANGAGTSVAHEGECADDVGCQADSDCADGETCEQVWCITWPCPALCTPAPEPEPNSCEDQCGGSSADDSCWCDAYCSAWGDCCEDFAEVCPAS
jgi:hypothetical protein